MYKPEFRRYCLLSNKMYDSADIEDDTLRQLDGDNDQEYMMYIGRKDKNGKKIFIGDILATSNDDPEYDIWSKEDNGYTVVEGRGEELGYRFSHWHLDYPDQDSIYSEKYVEVIGNIYEDTELIK